jgi:hypothetical protein
MVLVAVLELGTYTRLRQLALVDHEGADGEPLGFVGEILGSLFTTYICLLS